MRDALSRRAARAGDRAAAAGAHAARRVGGASASRGSRHRRARPRICRCPTCAASARPHDVDAADAPAVERPLRGDADGRRLRLQPLARPRGHALARRRDARRLGAATLRCATSRRGAVWSAGYQPSGAEPDSLRGDVHRRSRRDHPRRRRPHHHARSRRLVRRRRRGAARLGHRISAAARARSSSPRTRRSCWRRRPPTSRTRHSRSCSCETEFVPRHGAILATRRRRAPDEPELWAAHLAVVEGDVIGGTGVRNRPRALPRPRPRMRDADGA